jgi:AraC-like DNA-binding protein
LTDSQLRHHHQARRGPVGLKRNSEAQGIDYTAGMSPRIVDDTTFRRLIRARDFLASGHANHIRLDEAAHEACLSPFHFQRLFARTFGESPHELVTRLRMERARRLLEAGEMPVTEICMEIGYASLGTFSRRFADRVGQSPSEYRRAARRWVAPRNGWRIYRLPTCFVNFWLAEQQD